MAGPGPKAGLLLQAKLHPPRAAHDAIARPQLVEYLTQGMQQGCRLTLVLAPAGYGKSSLLADWTKAVDRPVAWLSLDERDDHLPRFLRYLVASLRSLFPDACPATRDLLQAPELPPPDYLAEILAADLAEVPEPFIQILDDYHLLADPGIHACVGRLIQVMPENMHLALAARFDPPLPLSRWRARGQLNELRGVDLRFDHEEARTFLERSLGVKVPDQVVDSLEERTEGWITALRMAALAMRGQTDLEASLARIQAVTGRQAASFLLDEVLAAQPAAVQDFLLKTSILNRFCASLCLAVMGPGEMSLSTVQALLEQQEQANPLLVVLDDEHQWYRYHQLLRDSLRTRLLALLSSEEVNALRRRASAWYVENGFLEEALQQALAAGDVDGAAAMVARNVHPALDREQHQDLEHWLAMLPETAVTANPTLIAGQAFIAQRKGQLDRVPALLVAADEALERVQRQPEEPEIVATQILLDSLASMVYQLSEQNELALEYAERALQRTLPGYPFATAIRWLWWGQAMQALGHEQEAMAGFRTALASSDSDHISYRANLLYGLMFCCRSAGRLYELAETGSRLLAAATEGKLGTRLKWAQTYLGYVAYQWNDLEGAVSHFLQIYREPGSGHTLALRDCAPGLALAYQAQGKPDLANQVAADWSDFLLRANRSSEFPAMYSLQAHLSLLQGDLEAAERRLELVTMSRQTSGFDWLESPLQTQCRVLLARGTQATIDQAAQILDGLSRHTLASHNVPRSVNALILRALAHEGQGHPQAAVTSLEHAVRLALPGRYVRPFLEPGLPVANLLGRLAEHHGQAGQPDQALAGYVQQLRSTFRGSPGPPRPLTPPPRPGNEALVEPLTDRELEVLGLLARHFAYKEIAAELVITVGTVKAHTRNIYAKLGVDNSRAAVARARELGILPPA